MPKPKLLYLCLNDGSDTRVNKEVKTLAKQYSILYVGIGQSQARSFVAPFCDQFILIKGHHKEKITFLKYSRQVISLLVWGRYQSIHVINEQLVLLFYPFLLLHRKKVVLDIFDSIFLRINRKLDWLKKLVYQLPKSLIVTDDNRKGLMPEAFRHKVTVVENFPYRFVEEVAKMSREEELMIFYNGSMSRSRGTEFLRSLMVLGKGVRVQMAGWIYDDSTKALSEHPQVSFLGVISQQESMHVAAQCDYILSLYEPINQNNINASPNKIYDAMQAQTPVIINREVKIAAFVKEQKIGYVLDSFYEENLQEILEDLICKKHSFTFDATLIQKYTWEAVEEKLLAAHNS